MPLSIPDFRMRKAELWLAILVPVLVIGILAGAYGVSSTVKHETDLATTVTQDTAGLPSQLRTEHAMLLLAAQTGADEKTIKLRGDIYLSFVYRLRKSAEFEAHAGVLKEQLAQFEETVHRTRWLLAHLDADDGRDALRHWLRQNGPFIVDFTLTLSKLYREQAERERVHRAKILRVYAYLLQLLHVAVLAAVLFASWMGLKLLRTLRERDSQNATQASILKLVDDGIFGISAAGKILFFNARADVLLGGSLRRGWVLPRSGPGDAGLLTHVRSFIGENGAGAVMRQSIQTADGDGMRHYTLSISPCGEESGRPEWRGSRVITIRDVTFDVEAARQKAEYEARISEAGRVMSYAVITGGIVHEISQPLAALRNYAHVLRRSPEFMAVPVSVRSIVGHIDEEAERVAEIVRNVRLMGPQEARLDGSCRLDEAVGQSLRLLKLGTEPAPTITVSSAGRDDLVVRGSLPLIGQVIINLVKNALQASAAAGRAGAQVFLRRSEGYAEIAVADFGTGVRPEAASGLFVPFAKSSGDGMGLGLSICQRIARGLGGSISWENGEAGGAIFKFQVPLVEKGQTP